MLVRKDSSVVSETALIIGGTRFIGRHTVTELYEHGYDVVIFNRGNHDNPFADDPSIRHVQGDRTDTSRLEAVATEVNPDIVIDCVAYQPQEVQAAVDIFADVDAYVYISSGDAYASEEIPKRESETSLRPCSPEQAVDSSADTYGNRKAEGDRIIFNAAADGVNAMSVRPCIVYGPHDYTERLDYWINRINTYDRIVMPGDGLNIWHRAYVKDVAKALRIVAEQGTPGEAYNVGDRRIVTLAEMIELIADQLDTTVELVPAGPRELQAGGLQPEDFILYRDYPHVLDTTKLSNLGWKSTPIETAMSQTVTDHLNSDRDGTDHDPGRGAEEQVLEILDTL